MDSALYYFLVLPTAAAFLVYGFACLLTDRMRTEFERFGLPGFRRLIGLTQLIGAIALLVGYRHPMIGFVGSTGLALQMALGVGVRVRIRDTWLQASQAAVFLVSNALLAVLFWNRI